MTPLVRAMIRAACLADALEMAPTPLELARLQEPRAGAGVVAATLALDAELRQALAVTGGFVTLRGREALAAERTSRLAVAEEKWVAALRAARRLRRVPWLRLVAVCNTVAMGLPREGSDVDLFLVSRPGRLWIVRFLAHAALAAGNLARRGSRVADAACLSFSVSERALDLSAVAKTPSDPYLAVWFATLMPVMDRGGVYDALLAANPTMPVEPRLAAPARRVSPSFAARALEILLFPFGGLLDRLARALQRPRILANPASRVRAGGTDVVVTDDMLKFHEEDKREAIRAAFLERTARYGV